MRWLYTGDDPAVFPTLQNADGTTVSVRPGDVVEPGEHHPAHRWLVPDDGTTSTPASGSDDDAADPSSDEDANAPASDGKASPATTDDATNNGQ